MSNVIGHCADTEEVTMSDRARNRIAPFRRYTDGTIESRLIVQSLILILLCTSDAVSQQSAPVVFRIAAQPINQALKQFALQSRLQLIFVTSEVAAAGGAHEVIGKYAPEIALAKLLADTCLHYRFVNANTVSIEILPVVCRQPWHHSPR